MRLDEYIIWSTEIENRRQAETICNLCIERGGSIGCDWQELKDEDLIRLAQEIWDRMRRKINVSIEKH